jgi:hypothetical protein
MPAYISHGTFQTFRKSLEAYEHHSKRNFIGQIPNLMMRKVLQVKEKVKDNMKAEIDMQNKDDSDPKQQQQSKKEMRQAYARKII